VPREKEFENELEEETEDQPLDNKPTQEEHDAWDEYLYPEWHHGYYHDHD
jgi:hypothetical protein